MQKIRMYFSFINEQSHKSAKSRAADRHNLRVEKGKSPNFNFDWSKNNLLFINGEKVNPLNVEENYKLVTDTIKKIRSDYDNHHQFESMSEKKKKYNERDQSKRAIAKWANNDKNTQKERDFWTNLLNDIENQKVLSSSQLLADFEALELGKVQSYNYKIKRIGIIENLNSSKKNEAERIKPLTVISKEILFKIPDQYLINLEPDEWIKITRNILNKLYPEFDTIYETVHCDENPENSHIHIRLSGLNNDTYLFDIGDALLNKLRDKLGIDKDKTYSQLNGTELSSFGEQTQDMIYSLFNEELQITLGNKYNISVHKRTPDEVEADPRTFEDAKLSSVKREFNAQQKLKEQNRILDNYIKKKISQIKNNNLNSEKDDLDKKVESFEYENKSIKLIDLIMDMFTEIEPESSGKYLDRLSEIVGDDE